MTLGHAKQVGKSYEQATELLKGNASVDGERVGQKSHVCPLSQSMHGSTSAPQLTWPSRDLPPAWNKSLRDGVCTRRVCSE